MSFSKIKFPNRFLWGASTAGYQIEGQNENADIYAYENIEPSVFGFKSGLACNSYELWEKDLELISEMNLNCYRFSIEWSRIQPEENMFSDKEINHYKQIIKACLNRGIEPVITLCHFSTPIWFAALGGWTNPNSSSLFSSFCQKIGESLLDGVKYVITLNEPNILMLLNSLGSIPEGFWFAQKEMLDAAAIKYGSKRFSGTNAINREDFDISTDNLILAHTKARNVLKEIHPDINVGFSLAVFDDQAACSDSIYKEKQQEIYGRWIPVSDDADFIGVQNYEKVMWDNKGPIPVPDGEITNFSGSWVDATSLANSVTTLFEMTGKPIFVTEHGIGTDDDDLRSSFLTESLKCLAAITEQVPVIGYAHWTLIDNYEWVNGFNAHFGLYSFDKETFVRKPKNSAKKYAQLVSECRSLEF